MLGDVLSDEEKAYRVEVVGVAREYGNAAASDRFGLDISTVIAMKAHATRGSYIKYPKTRKRRK